MLLTKSPRKRVEDPPKRLLSAESHRAVLEATKQIQEEFRDRMLAIERGEKRTKLLLIDGQPASQVP
jgi:hypothetical protein